MQVLDTKTLEQVHGGTAQEDRDFIDALQRLIDAINGRRPIPVPEYPVIF